MKVLFVSSGNSKTGISPFIKSQGESLKTSGIQLDFFTINKRGFKGYLRESMQLRKYLRLHEYEILHAHYGMSALAALIARRKEKIVVSFMGDDIVGANKPNGSLTKASLLLARFNAFLAKKFYDYAIVKSEAMLTRLKIPNITLIPNGVDLVKFKPLKKIESKIKLGIAPEEKLTIFVSDPSRVEKNFPLAQNAVKLLKNPELKLFPVFNQPNDSLPSYYNAADVLLLTSFHEGSPNVIKEAMACNCPIVSTAVGDVKWVFGNTEGYFLSSFKVEEMAEKIKMALEFAIIKDRTKGRERILELGLDSETIARKIVSVYKRVLK
ncbi:MAG: glycosyltransferase family 4 protein [Candidatus Aminicenantes bacterium]|nr:glycosyltransferase family 4 protein [Candidatus Aminicenantes bacterium]